MNLIGFHGFRELINVHPVFVHFPIGLLTASALFYLVGVVVKNNGLYEAGRWTLWLGTLSAVAAVWTGLRAAIVVQHNEEVHQIMILHQNIGYLILILALSLSVGLLISRKPIPGRMKGLFLTGMVILAALLAPQADLGGSMVYSHGVGVGKKSMVPVHRHDQSEAEQRPHVGEGTDPVTHSHQGH